MKYIRSFIIRRRTLILFFFICHILFAISNKPLFDLVHHPPPATVDPWVHHGEVDYYTYLTFIRESRAGAWTVPALFTTEPAQRSFIYTYYIGVGKFAGLFHLSPVAAYHVARILTFEFFIVSLYLLCVSFLGKKAGWWAALVGIFSTTPLTVFGLPMYGGGRDLYVASTWWYNLDPLYRIDYVPHHAFGISCLFIVILCILHLYKTPTIPVFVFTLIVSFVTALIFPTPALVIIFAVPVAYAWSAVKTYMRSKPIDIRFAVTIITIAACAGLAIVIIQKETYKGFPWSQWREWDIAVWNTTPNFERDFIVAGGIVLLASIPSFVMTLWKKNDFPSLFISVWAILPYLLLPFTDQLQLAKIRLGFLANFVPLGILTVQTVLSVGARISSRQFRYGLYALCIVFFVLFSYPNTAHYYNDKVNLTNVRTAAVQVPITTMDAMKYFAQYAKPYTVVLVPEFVGIALPAFAPTRTYCCHVVHTKNYDEKSNWVKAFYSGTLTQNAVLFLLKNQQISYIFQVTADGWFPIDIASYQLPVSVWYKNSGVTIYKVAQPSHMP